jgi:GNAT superfamily N-acetyltransferase
VKRAVLPTRELAALIEASESRLLHGFFDAARRLRPDAGFECLETCGGLAVFMGAASPLSVATGFGLDARISIGDLERVTHFYHQRGTASVVAVNPLADPSLERALSHLGYAPRLRNNVLAIDAAKSDATRDSRVAEETDATAWAHASARGFTERYSNYEEGALLATAIALGTGVVALSARKGGDIVATGAMSVYGTLASLFAGSTLDEHRGNGYHRAMILDRVARARETGARYARTAAPIGSTSEVNFRSCGFEVLYTRTAWELPPVKSQPA